MPENIDLGVIIIYQNSFGCDLVVKCILQMSQVDIGSLGLSNHDWLTYTHTNLTSDGWRTHFLSYSISFIRELAWNCSCTPPSGSFTAWKGVNAKPRRWATKRNGILCVLPSSFIMVLNHGIPKDWKKYRNGFQWNRIFTVVIDGKNAKIYIYFANDISPMIVRAYRV